MQPEVKEAVVRYLKEQKPGRILDIPSGSGWLENSIGTGWEYYAADLFVEGGSERFQKVDLNGPLPYESASFDYIACLEGLEHIENHHHALREFARILHPNGKLIISTPNPLNVKSRLRFLSWGTFHGFPHLIKMPPEGEHLHISPVNLSFLISFAAKYGLHLERIHPLRVPGRMYSSLWLAALIKAHTYIKLLPKDIETKIFVSRLHTWNVLLNNEIVVSFTRRN